VWYKLATNILFLSISIIKYNHIYFLEFQLTDYMNCTYFHSNVLCFHFSFPSVMFILQHKTPNADLPSGVIQNLHNMKAGTTHLSQQTSLKFKEFSRLQGNFILFRQPPLRGGISFLPRPHYVGLSWKTCLPWQARFRLHKLSFVVA
jgi:hypothetical protein